MTENSGKVLLLNYFLPSIFFSLVSNIEIEKKQKFQDQPTDLKMESTRLSVEFPVESEVIPMVVGYDATELLAEDNNSESENWEQKCCDQNGFTEEANHWKTYSSNQESPRSDSEERERVEEKAGDVVPPGIQELSPQADKQNIRHSIMSHSHDTYNNSNGVINGDNGNEYDVDFDNNNADNNKWSNTKDDDIRSVALRQDNKFLNGTQLPEEVSSFESTTDNKVIIVSEANDCEDKERSDKLKVSIDDNIVKIHSAINLLSKSI